MVRQLTRCFYPFAVGAIIASVAAPIPAAETLVFISSFAKGGDGSIHAYQFDSKTGRLKLVHKTGDMEHPFFMVVSPDKKFLYATHAPGQFGGPDNEFVAAYQIVSPTGELKLLNRQSALGRAACYLEIDQSGKSLLVANYSSGSTAVLPIREDGSLGEAKTFLQHENLDLTRAPKAVSHSHCAIVSPDNRYVFIADLGFDAILSFNIDATAAQLTPHRQPFVRTVNGAGPRHLTFDPSGKHLYAINELNSSVTLFDYLPETGILIERQTLPTLPPDFTAFSKCADLKFTPDGRFLYGTNRGHDSIAMYAIGESGTLKLIGIEPSLGQGPQNLVVTPDGRYLICCNMPGNNVAVFQIDPQTGKLKSVGDPLSIPGPSCVRIR